MAPVLGGGYKNHCNQSPFFLYIYVADGRIERVSIGSVGTNIEGGEINTLIK